MSIYTIAEMACSHEGDPLLAKKIIDGAGSSGANAIQFQIWQLSEVMVPHHRDFRRAQKLELNYEEWQELSSYSRTRYPGMQIIACVYETKSVDFCETIDVDAYKIHTADLSNPFLVKHVAKKKKRIDLSVGASTLEEIRAAVKWIQSVSKCEIYLMYGLQNFPTPSDDVNLEFMMKLKETLQLPIGYQDHSDAETSSSFWLPAAAIGMGVDILEKHITHDRSLKGADHESALNPDEFKTFVDMVHDVESAKGSAHEKKFSPGQLKYRKYSKKSLVAKHALSAGQMLTENDLSFMRADDLGLPPDQANKVVGKRTKCEIAAYHLIREEDVS